MPIVEDVKGKLWIAIAVAAQYAAACDAAAVATDDIPVDEVGDDVLDVAAAAAAAVVVEVDTVEAAAIRDGNNNGLFSVVGGEGDKDEVLLILLLWLLLPIAVAV